VLSGCPAGRQTPRAYSHHPPRRRTGRPEDPILDPNALAKGWIIEEAATALRMTGREFLVNAGGDVVASSRGDAAPWRVGIQHPLVRSAILGTFTVEQGAVATSGTYERGAHIRSAAGAHDARLLSVTVVGPDLAWADALATAVFASGHSPPAWWADIDPAYGLLTMSADDRLRWLAPSASGSITWHGTSLPVRTAQGSNR
jgi:thiamine biosynthesis lipoprotein